MELYGIVGVGGFGREVLPLAQEFLLRSVGKEQFELVFVVENLKEPEVINGHKVISMDDFLSHDCPRKRFNIAIADHKARERIANYLKKSNLSSFSIVASNSICLESNEIGEGAILCPFSTITANARIGSFFHLNIYSYVAHDCSIGNYVTFAPNVHCNGNVTIEDYAYIGTGAIIKPGSSDKPITIGEGAVVGMGSVVNKSIEPYTIVAGNTAKLIGTVN